MNIFCSVPRLLKKELTHITNQVFEQTKIEQRDPVPNSNASNENETTQTSNQTIV